MSKEIITKIKEVEAEAEQIRSNAEIEAKARVRRAEEEGKRLCERSEQKAQRQNKEKLEITKARADAALADAREDSLAEAEAMREAAEFNMREAVRTIIAGVKEQCQ